MTTIFQRGANFQQSPERWKSWESNDATAQSCALCVQTNAAGFDNDANRACRRPATHHRP